MERLGPILRIERAIRGHFRRRLKLAALNSGELLEKLKSIRHPNLMSVYEFDDKYVYVEYIDGLILSNRSPNCPNHHTQCWIDTHKSIDLSPILDAVRTLHANGICHGDITSHNVMIRKDGTPKLIDLTCSLPRRAAFVERDLAMFAAIEREVNVGEQSVTDATSIEREVDGDEQSVTDAQSIDEWMDRIESELKAL
jgi:serine/threonine protein kinase